MTQQNPVSKNLLQAWQKTVLSLARMSKKQKEDPDLSGTIRKLARGERSKILKLRDAFTSERESLSYALLNSKENILAYLLGFHMPNVYRLLMSFRRLEKKWKWSLKNAQAKSLTVWDLGCGSGALSQFFMERYAEDFESNRAYLYDTNSLLLETCKTGFERLGLSNLKLFPRKVGLHALNTEPKVFPDELVVIGLGYVWNELERNPLARKNILDLIAHYRKHKAKMLVCVMEPGQDFASRSAMKLRDQLVLDQGFIPLYPCPHLKACPLLKKDKDWCYSEFSTEGFPKDSLYIDELMEIDRTLIASSAFVFASPELFSTMQHVPKAQAVVVGRPKTKEGTGFSYLLCTPQGEIEKGETVVSRGAVRLRGEAESTL